MSIVNFSSKKSVGFLIQVRYFVNVHSCKISISIVGASSSSSTYEYVIEMKTLYEMCLLLKLLSIVCTYLPICYKESFIIPLEDKTTRKGE